MSADEYSDGDLDIDGESNGSPAPPGSQHDDSKKHARAMHNKLERRRRDAIKAMYGSLKDEMPNFNNSERASRAHVLKKTIDSIEEQKAENQTLSDDVQQIKAENERLLKEIEELEAAAALRNPQTTAPAESKPPATTEYSAE